MRTVRNLGAVLAVIVSVLAIYDHFGGGSHGPDTTLVAYRHEALNLCANVNDVRNRPTPDAVSDGDDLYNVVPWVNWARQQLRLEDGLFRDFNGIDPPSDLRNEQRREAGLERQLVAVANRIFSKVQRELTGAVTDAQLGASFRPYGGKLVSLQIMVNETMSHLAGRRCQPYAS
jgi:hypothetical protein